MILNRNGHLTGCGLHEYGHVFNRSIMFEVVHFFIVCVFFYCLCIAMDDLHKILRTMSC